MPPPESLNEYDIVREIEPITEENLSEMKKNAQDIHDKIDLCLKDMVAHIHEITEVAYSDLQRLNDTVLEKFLQLSHVFQDNEELLKTKRLRVMILESVVKDRLANLTALLNPVNGSELAANAVLSSKTNENVKFTYNQISAENYAHSTDAHTTNMKRART